MNPKEFVHKTAYSVQLPYIAGHSLERFQRTKKGGLHLLKKLFPKTLKKKMVKISFLLVQRKLIPLTVRGQTKNVPPVLPRRPTLMLNL